ncbi:GntR family transcriptional regulator [Paenibacillus sp. P26]|nr:GntR family transcriptional regulator [Paenibacillus sp. P26]UUZ95192.1 GntR family transcriptional regulator [Paenibacillus sp. P25]
MEKMDYRLPIHIQLKQMILQKIEDEEYKLGDKIPSEREMAQLYGVNRMTVKHAVNRLVEEGYLKRVQGKGTFVVRTRMLRDLETLTGLSATIQDKGLVPSSKVIQSGVVEAFAEMNRRLGLGEEAGLFRLLRLRLGSGIPLALEDTYVPYELFADDIEKQDFEVLSLFEYMEQKGIVVKESVQSLTIEKINDREAKYLGIPPQHPVFAFTYTSRDQHGRLVEYTKSYTLGDSTNFEVTLR